MEDKKQCTPDCIFFSCNSDNDPDHKCSCDKYDIWVRFMDDCKDSDAHFTPVHDDFDEVIFMYDMVNTDIICPNCATRNMIRKEPKVIKSNTETYDYLCPACGFVHTAKSDEDMKEWIKSLDKPIEEEILKETRFCNLEGAPSKCLNEHCEDAEVFKDKLMCTFYNKWFDLTPVEKGETDYHAKQDEGKLQLHLVPPQIIRDIAEVRMYGNDKYGDPDNWKTVEKWRYVDALLRHLLLYLEDPDGVDEESGIKHYKHAACNMAFICAMEEGNEQ